MARGKKKESALTSEEKLMQALVPVEEQPYKVPENWCWVKFGQLAIDMADGPFGSNLKTEHYTQEKQARIIQLSNIGENGWREENTKYTTFEHAKTISRSIVEPGNIVIAKMMPAGRAILCPNEEAQYVLSSDAVKMVPQPQLNSKFLLFQINSNHFQLQVQENTQGITRARTSIKKLKEYAFAVPPISEQQRIVDRIEYLFAKLDEAKEKAQSVLDSFETRKAAILHKAFTGELTAKWRAEHGVGIENWTEQTIGDLIKVSSGKALTAKNMVSDGEIPVYGGNGVTGYHNESNVEPDTVVIGRVGYYCGSVHYIAGPAWVTDNALIVSYRQEINKQYLVHLLRHADLRQNDSSTAQPVVSGSKIYPIVVHTAPLNEQSEIVRILDSLFTKEQQAKEAAEAVLEKIDLLKKSILARAFRGELGTNDPTEESALELLKNNI